MNNSNLKSLFSPKTVAIIGASPDKNKVGGKVFQKALLAKNIKIIPVNPTHTKIDGIKTYPSVELCREKIDIAVIVVKAEIVAGVLEQIVKLKIPFCIIISSGFKERGAEGEKRENELKKITENSLTRILGPNCLGLLTNKLNLTFGPNIEHSGDISVLSQSGAIGASLIDFLNQRNIGLHSFISLGNKLDLSENDFLEHLKGVKEVESIFLYLESFKNGQNFFKLSQNLTSVKPITVLKPGKTVASRRAMTSHTGALISDEVAVKTAFNQANIINAETLEDFFQLLTYFSCFPANYAIFDCKDNPPKIVTNAGGMGVLLADELPGVSPVDIGGAAKAKDYEIAISKFGKNIPSLFVALTPQEVTEVEETANLIVSLQKKVKYPIFSIFAGGGKVKNAHKIFEENRCLSFDFPEDATNLYHKICAYQIRAKENIPTFKPKKVILTKRSDYLNSLDAQKLALEYGLPINPEYQVESLNECLTVSKRLKFPVVLKLESQKYIHKTEHKAVRLNIESREELEKEYKELMNLKKEDEKAFVTISRELKRNLEVIIGVKKDMDFGHLIMFGMGGIYAEIMQDLSYGLLPMTKSQIKKMIARTKTYKILEGTRGLPKLDLKGVEDCIEKLGLLISENPWISELDINPLFVSEKGVSIVDFKVK